MNKELEQYSSEKLAQAEKREQKRLYEKTVLDFMLDCIFANSCHTAQSIYNRAARLKSHITRLMNANQKD